MEIRIKELKKPEVEIEVELSEKELKKYIEQTEKLFQVNLDLEGFRKGKVPLDVLRKTVGEEKILEETLSLAVKDSFDKVLEEKELDLLEPAKGINIKENTKEKLIYVATIKVLPKVELSEYKGIKVEGQKVEVTQEEIDNTVEYVRKTRATYSDSNEPAKNGNKVEIDFEIKTDGKTIENGTSKNHPLVLGSKAFVPGFEENIVGMKKGEEKDFEIDVPKDYYQQSIAGKTIQGHVKVNKIENQSLPELNEEFVKTLGNFSTIEDLRNSIAQGIKLEKEEKEKNRIRAAILEKISENTEVDIPDVLVEKQLGMLIGDFDKNLHQRGLELNMYLVHLKKTQDDLRKEWRSEAVKQVKNSLILREVAKEEDIKVDEDELNESVAGFLQKFQNPEELKDVDGEVLKKNMYDNLIREKTLQLLEKNSEITN